MTEKLYDADSHLCEFTARVTECKECDGGYAVILDRTAFSRRAEVRSRTGA